MSPYGSFLVSIELFDLYITFISQILFNFVDCCVIDCLYSVSIKFGITLISKKLHIGVKLIEFPKIESIFNEISCNKSYIFKSIMMAERSSAPFKGGFRHWVLVTLVLKMIELKLCLIRNRFLFLLVGKLSLQLNLNLFGWLSISTDFLFVIDLMMIALKFIMIYLDLLFDF